MTFPNAFQGVKKLFTSEILKLIALASLVLSLIICSRTDIGMTWIMLWILLTAGSSFLFQTIRLIWINKYRP